MNLLSASPVHQRIISVGREPLVEMEDISLGQTEDRGQRTENRVHLPLRLSRRRKTRPVLMMQRMKCLTQ